MTPKKLNKKWAKAILFPSLLETVAANKAVVVVPMLDPKIKIKD